MNKIALISALVALSMGAASGPALAQRTPGDYVNFQIYWHDNCVTPTPSGGTAWGCTASAAEQPWPYGVGSNKGSGGSGGAGGGSGGGGA